MKKFDIITIFPDILDSYLNESIIKRAIKKKLIRIKTWDLRKFSKNKHRKVDDRPYGGGPGMVLQAEPVYRAVKNIKSREKGRSRTILFSPRGKKLEDKDIKRLSKYDRLIMICGRYEGVDERVEKYIADETISIGDYILAGGELPAMVLTEAISRYVPGVLGKEESLESIKGSYPAYTRPEVIISEKGKKWLVPKVLLEGSHIKIEEWRKNNESKR
ncbi:MAG: tRNA (guanosine(37)-N1)-methyltransferase TrmD [Candidatus Colwellbacteria bacterium]|jgi:tRNA (guanine37-N1)-methyltransferase|nr:tRNA (guanosine(37)-N1)-methyltransferase TrmD [Candidatus Colwellbacteria bacterium]MCK9497503.1 tRNA (guanosine(37)-N1)-methyltransferase TrmD [Candidatus Colwellbacteria bacterium]